MPKEYMFSDLKEKMYALSAKYRFVSVQSVGKSVLGKDLLTLNDVRGTFVQKLVKRRICFGDKSSQSAL